MTRREEIERFAPAPEWRNIEYASVVLGVKNKTLWVLANQDRKRGFTHRFKRTKGGVLMARVNDFRIDSTTPDEMKKHIDGLYYLVIDRYEKLDNLVDKLLSYGFIKQTKPALRMYLRDMKLKMSKQAYPVMKSLELLVEELGGKEKLEHDLEEKYGG